MPVDVVLLRIVLFWAAIIAFAAREITAATCAHGLFIVSATIVSVGQGAGAGAGGGKPPSPSPPTGVGVGWATAILKCAASAGGGVEAGGMHGVGAGDVPPPLLLPSLLPPLATSEHVV